MVECDVCRSSIERFREAIENFRLARIRFSQEYMLSKGSNNTDRTAEHIAILETKDELTTLQAERDLARNAVESTAQSHSQGKHESSL